MPVFYRTCRDSKYGLLGWAIGIFAFMMLMGWYYPSFSEEQEALEALLESVPDGMWALLGVKNAADMMSGAGFLTIEAFSLMLPIFFSIFAMGIGSQAIAGEETDGTLELLATMPISRGRLYFEKFLGLLFLLVLLGICLGLSVLVASTWGNMGVSAAPIAGSSLMVVLLGLFFGTVTLVIGSITGRRGQTVAISTGVIVVTYALNAVAQMIESLTVIQWLSPFYFYSEGMSLAQDLQLRDATPLVSGIIVFGMVGFFVFRERDIN